MHAQPHVKTTEAARPVLQAHQTLVVDGDPSAKEEDCCIICLEATRERRPEAMPSSCACSFPCHAACYDAYVAQTPSVYKCPICRRCVRRPGSDVVQLGSGGRFDYYPPTSAAAYAEFWIYLLCTSICSFGFLMPVMGYWVVVISSSNFKGPVITRFLEIVYTLVVLGITAMFAFNAFESGRAWCRGE